MKKSDDRPLGITLLGWSYIVVGGINLAYIIFAYLWNIFMGPKTNSYWDMSQPIGTFVLLTAYILIGIGILRLNKSAYVITFVLSALFLIGGVMWLADALDKQNNVEIGVSSVCLFVSILIPVYLIRMRKFFFKS